MLTTQKIQLFDPGFLFTPSDSFYLGRTVLPQYKTSQTTDRQTDDRRYIVPKARPIVRLAKMAQDRDLVTNGAPIGNGMHGMKWSHDRRCHVNQKVQSLDLVIFRCKYLENGLS